MGSLFRSLFAAEEELTPTQKLMYASEKLNNFRLISRLCATRSSYTLTANDLAPADLYVVLADLGEFAQIASNIPETQYVFDNKDMLLQRKYPFEGFEALRDAELLSAFKGTVAAAPVITVYRPGTKQLVVGFGGTTNIMQTLYDIYPVRRRLPYGNGCVHSGFYAMYKGCRDQVIDAVRQAFDGHDVQELAIVGHSMGGALSYLFAVDVLAGQCPLPAGTPVTVATYGCPRLGDAALSQFWRQFVAQYQAANGEASVKDFSVKGLNDGVPSLPPVSWGYRHIACTPFYFYHGRLFHIPAAEAEHGVFTVEKDALDQTRIPDHPRGGHNYYNGRDTEKVVRRAYWLDRMISEQSSGWQEKYLAKIAELEQVK
ncbi:Alpha/Beta hydrolase protein [Rhodofomes roseus]|uniref:Alpha/Beta hydrolase protein n=1 Tax=Rhodofomes roseus TaxID=34475 RepID=A0ABQ8KSA2_9APHY|nr:Alpha/Beta hydrolase protein [Rhodofomes roseus]KAH9840819.1 Alpha/Beta hydrolase protein [Rhodofomes roseus]